MRFDPVGGGQFQQMIKKIMDSERAPVKTMEARKEKEQARVKLFQDFKERFNGLRAHLDEFTNIRKFRELKADLGIGADLMNVSLDKERAEPGSYEIEVNEMAHRSSIISNGVEDPKEPLFGIGFVVMPTADGTKDIFVTESQASLQGIANLINAESETPVQASVLRDEYDSEKPWRLILTAKKEGDLNRVDFPDFYFLDGQEDLYVENDRDARNATLLVDGFQIETNGNNVDDFLTGVGIQLKQAKPDAPFMLKISEDYEKMAGKMEALVQQINKVLEFINKQNQIDKETDTRSTFAGDTSLQGIEYKLRNMIHQGFAISNSDGENYRVVYLNQAGVRFEKTGMITFDKQKFIKYMEKDFEGVAKAVTGDGGFAQQLRNYFNVYSQSGNGLLATKEEGLKSRIRQIDDNISRKNEQLTRKEEALVRKFANLSATVSGMQQQQAYLQQSMGAAASMGGAISSLIG